MLGFSYFSIHLFDQSIFVFPKRSHPDVAKSLGDSECKSASRVSFQDRIAAIVLDSPQCVIVVPIIREETEVLPIITPAVNQSSMIVCCVSRNIGAVSDV
jgi:hypothetical protein